MSSKESKKIRLYSKTDQCENQNEEESDRSAESFQSLNFKLEDLPDEVILKVLTTQKTIPIESVVAMCLKDFEPFQMMNLCGTK